MALTSHNRRYIYSFFVGFWILAVVGYAAPTHRLAGPFQSTVAGQVVSLPAGTEVEVTSDDGKMAVVRHTLSGGSATLLFIPSDLLKTLVAEQNTPSPPPAANIAGSPAHAVEKPPGIRFATKDGKTFAGSILRVEKHYVVILNEAGEAEDVLLVELDESSLGEIKRWKFQTGTRKPEADPRLQPGNKFSLVFPELGASRSSDPARIQIRIPDNYQPDKPVPLALYFGGGQGTDNCDALNSLVDSKEWVTGKLIAFQQPMLDRLEALLANTDPKRRVVIGSSNGAHMIAIGACDGWKEFSEYFSAFVMHEGGGSESNDFKSLRRKAVFVLMGGQSKSLNFSKRVVTNVKKARIKPDVFVAEQEGHGLGDASRVAIKKWVAELPAK